MKQSNNRISGFTLIEFLVVLALMGVIMALGLAAWTNYRDTRALDEAGLELVSQLRSARARAINGNKPTSGCVNLVGYQVNSSLEVVACCRNGAESCDNVVKTFELSFLVDKTFSNFPIKFLSGNGRANRAASIDLVYHGKQGTVTISELGASIEWERST